MCRLVAYLGERVVLNEVLFQPDSSIVEQAVYPQLLSAMNLAGFGVVAWDDASPSAELPWTYRTAGVPFFDRNLRALSRKARGTALLGHVRGVLLSDREVVSEQNVHPFRYEGIPIALAMNGDLDREAQRGATVIAAGESTPALFIVLRGAVETTIRRGGLAARARLAGPGRMVGHLRLVDREPTPATSRARERSILLEVPRERVAGTLGRGDDAGRRFALAVYTDVVDALVEAQRPISRMAAVGG